MKKIPPIKLLEVAWLIVSLLSLGAGLHKSIRFGFRNSIAFFVIALFAFLMYYFRRKWRTSSEE